MPKKLRQPYTVDELREIALQYSSRTAFFNGHKTAYQAAVYKEIMDEICGHMSRPNQVWTHDKIKEEAQRWSNRSEFLKNAPNAYNAAYRRGLLDELFTTTTQSQGV